jgi:Skp family chaperone for outer membrane proteins
MRALIALLICFAQPIIAQEAPRQQIQRQSSVLIIDNEDVFTKTLFGQRLLSDLDAEARLIQSENQRIIADLLAEESALTQQRPTMDAEEFRAAAAAFDAKAQAFRQERDAAKTALRSKSSSARTEFLQRVTPIIARLMIERGASVVIDRTQKSVFLNIDTVDITADAIILIDRMIGEGNAPPADPSPSVRDGGTENTPSTDN